MRRRVATTAQWAAASKRATPKQKRRRPSSTATVTATSPAVQHMPATMLPSRPRHAGKDVPPGFIYGLNEDATLAATTWKNEDGSRIEDGRYAKFVDACRAEIGIPAERIFQDPVRTFAYGTDASFYRLIPKVVIKVHNEDEVRKMLPIATRLQVPVTFRAAGTSLSGQACTDSVLVKLSHTSKNWRNYEISPDGDRITLEPGLIGGEVNRLLLAHQKRNKLPVQYKIGPDPASIDSCMIGGIVSNNSSGMCCGVKENTYNTLEDMRVVWRDGSVLDTGSDESCAAFAESHFELLNSVSKLAAEVQADPELSALIRKKYRIKCTTGYAINALVDFPPANPIEIVKRLMIGSEGTLGFISKVTYKTVPEHPHKASMMILFPDFHSAGRATVALRDSNAVDAVEVFDRASLAEGEKDANMCELLPGLAGCGAECAALLIECRGADEEKLHARIATATGALLESKTVSEETVEKYPFRHDEKVYCAFWDFRKGLIPMVGASRVAGTSMLIEDVACPVENLADMSCDLIAMFKRNNYKASVFGHAMEGNMHLVFAQGFNDGEDLDQFSDMMDDMCNIVAVKYGGSLKGEHGTGRNVAPYVELEWGKRATDIMWRVKQLFDPEGMLNPGVILNVDPLVHLKNLKPSPLASKLVDRCIECGFCESNCPSKDLSLTPRQRITTWREVNRLQRLVDSGLSQPSDRTRLVEMREGYEYDGIDTCAADGMCQEKCPVKINTGDLIKSIRADKAEAAPPDVTSRGADWLADNFQYFDKAVPPLLNTVALAHKVLGTGFMTWASDTVHGLGNNQIPAWNPHMPKGAKALPVPPPAPEAASLGPAEVGDFSRPTKVVYLPTCITRTMGPSADDPEQTQVADHILSILGKAGCEVVYPRNIETQCCGLMFHSRGQLGAYETKVQELEAALVEASENGRYPIVCDTSPCLKLMKDSMKNPMLQFALFEPIEFVHKFLLDRLEFKKVKDNVAIHVPCSSKKMKLEPIFMDLAGRCAETVTPSGIPCCGMAGDRGMRYPELTGASLQHLQTGCCKDGYSTSRTCEMSLSNHSEDTNFRSIAYLLDEGTEAKREENQ